MMEQCGKECRNQPGEDLLIVQQGINVMKDTLCIYIGLHFDVVVHQTFSSNQLVL